MFTYRSKTLSEVEKSCMTNESPVGFFTHYNISRSSYSGLLVSSERILNVLGQKKDLIHGRPAGSKPACSLGAVDKYLGRSGQR